MTVSDGLVRNSPSGQLFDVEGARGAFGGAFTFPYTFLAGTGVDPGLGQLSVNLGPQNTSTEVLVSEVDADSTLIATALDTIDASTNPVKGFVRVVNEVDTSKWLLFTVTAISAAVLGVRTLSVTCVASSAPNPLADLAPVLFCFTQDGDKGDTGPTDGWPASLILDRHTGASSPVIDAGQEIEFEVGSLGLAASGDLDVVAFTDIAIEAGDELSLEALTGSASIAAAASASLTGGSGASLTATTGPATMEATAGAASVTASADASVTAGAAASVTGGTSASITATTGPAAVAASAGAASVTGQTDASLTATTGSAAVAASAGPASVTAQTNLTLTAITGLAALGASTGAATVTGQSGASVTATTGTATVAASAGPVNVTGQTTAALSAVTGVVSVTGQTGANFTATTGTASFAALAGAATLTGQLGASLTATTSTAALIATTGNATVTGQTGASLTAATGAAAVAATTGAASVTAGTAASLTGGTTASVTGGTGASVTATTGTLSLSALAGLISFVAALGFSFTATTGDITLTALAGSITLDGSVNATLRAGSGTASLVSTSGAATITGQTGASITATTGAAALAASAGAASVAGSTTASLTAGTTATVTGGSGATVTATTGSASLIATAAAAVVTGQTLATVTATTGAAALVAAAAAASVTGQTNATLRAVTGTASVTASAGAVAVTAQTSAAVTATTGGLLLTGQTLVDILSVGGAASLAATGGQVDVSASTAVNVTALSGAITLAASTFTAISNFLMFTAQAASTPTVGAGRGMFWTQTGTPTLPKFTDSTDTDFTLATLPVSPSSLAPQAANTVLLNATAALASPTAFPVGTNTVLGRVGANIVAAQLVTAQIAVNQVTNAVLAQMVANTVKVNATAALADPQDLAIGTNTLLGRVGANIVAAQLVDAQITTATISLPKLATQASDTLVANVTTGAASPTAVLFSSLVAATTSLAWDATNHRFNYIGSTSTVSATPSGAVGVLNIAALECGGQVLLTPSADANIDGFTAKAAGFWFDLIYTATTTFAVTLNNNVGTTTGIFCAGNVNTTFSTRAVLRLTYNGTASRWVVGAADSWSASLALGVQSGAFTPIIDTGQSLQFGSAAAPAGQIKSAAALTVISSLALQLSGSAVTATAATGNVTLTSTNAAVNATAATSMTMQSGSGNLTFGSTSASVNFNAGAAIGFNAASSITAIATAGNITLQTLATDINFTSNLAVNIAAATSLITLTTAATQSVNVSHFLKIMNEQAASTPSVGAGQGMLWIKDNTPTDLFFTDDTNADRKVATAPVPNTDLATMAANTVKANATAALATPTDVAVGTNTVLGRVGANIVAAQLVDAQITTATISLPKLAVQAANSVVLNATTGSASPTALAVSASSFLGRTSTSNLSSLTGAQGGEIIRFATEEIGPSVTGTYEPTLNAGTNIYRISPTAANDVTFNGFAFTGGNTGKMFLLLSFNGSGRIIIKNNSAGTFANGVYTPFDQDYILTGANSACIIWYHATAGHWNIVGAKVSDANHGDITVTVGGETWTINNLAVTTAKIALNAVTNAVLAQMAANTVKVNATAALANAQDLSIGTNTLLGRVAGNIVAAQAVNAQITGGSVSTVKGVALGGVAGTLADLTGTELTEFLRYATTQNQVLVATTNDLALNAAATVLRLSSATGPQTLTGITGGVQGRKVLIENIGASGNDITLGNLTTSAAANQFRAPGGVSYTIGFRSNVEVMWDASNSDWRVIERLVPTDGMAAIAANTALVNATAASASPTALAVGAGQVVGRAQTGNITALTGSNQGENLRWTVIVDTAATGTITSYAPVGYVSGTSNYVRVTPVANTIIRGMAIAAGCQMTIRVGRSSTFTFQLNHEDGAATAGEAFNCPDNANLVLRAGESCIITNSESRNNVVATGKIQALRKNSTGTVFTRAQTNLIEGAGITITMADDSTDNEVDVTFDQANNVQEDGPTAAGTYEPTLNANTRIYRVNPAGDVFVSFTGFAFTGGNTGKTFMLVKQGLDGWCEIQHNVGATAANGMFTPDEQPFVFAAANSGAVIWYQTSALRWNVAGFGTQQTPWNLCRQRVPFGTTNVLIAVGFPIVVNFAAGAGGAPDDHIIFNANAPFAFAISDCLVYVATAVVGSSIQLRNATGGGGSTLSSSLSTTATGTIRNNGTGIATVPLNGTLVIRRSDSGVAGQFVIFSYRF